MRQRTMILGVVLAVLACGTMAAEGKTKVVCVGDSITAGTGAPKGTAYPVQLGKLLGGDYEVIGQGMPSRTLSVKGGKPYSRDKLWKPVLASNANIVIFMLGTNDAKQAQVDKESFKADAGAMFKALAEMPSKPKVYVCTPIPAFKDTYGIQEKVLREQVAPLIVEVAREMNLPVIDTFAAMEGKGNLVPDGIHPDAAGQAVLAKAIAQAIAGQGGEIKTQKDPADKTDPGIEGKTATIVAPKGEAAAGKPWVWKAMPSSTDAIEAELLKKGFHVGYVDTGASFGSDEALKKWDAFYRHATEVKGLSKTPALVGVSRGGLFVHRWAAANPDKVSCIVGIAPVCDIKSWPAAKLGLTGGHGASWKLLLEAYKMTEPQALAWKGNPVDLAEPVGKAKIPVLHVYSPQDEAVPYEQNTKVYAQKLQAAGGIFTELPVEFTRDSIKGDAKLERDQKAVDAKNPKAVAGAHRKTCGNTDPKIAEFILKNAAGK